MEILFGCVTIGADGIGAAARLSPQRPSEGVVLIESQTRNALLRYYWYYMVIGGLIVFFFVCRNTGGGNGLSIWQIYFCFVLFWFYTKKVVL